MSKAVRESETSAKMAGHGDGSVSSNRGDGNRRDEWLEERETALAGEAATASVSPGARHTAGGAIEALSDVAKARQLNATLQQEVTHGLNDALPLCILLANRNLYPWFYENYVQLYSVHSTVSYLAGEVVQEDITSAEEVEAFNVNFLARPSVWLKECSLKEFLGRDPEEIIDSIIRSIDLGCYLRIEVDESCLPNKARYGTGRFIHPTLIYGYDNAARQFLGFGYDRNSFFSKLIYDYEDVARAYESAREVFEPLKAGLVTLIRPRAMDREYPFSVERFLRALHDYIYSVKDSAESYYLHSFVSDHAEGTGRLKFGFEVYSHLETSLQCRLQGKDVDVYKNFHLLFEQKRVLAGAFTYILSEHKRCGRLAEHSEEFDDVVRSFHAIRTRCFRYQHTNRIDLIREIAGMLDNAKQQEWHLLARIHEEIQSELL